MKKTTKKLVLAKETLWLAAAAGGEEACQVGGHTFACPSRWCATDLTH
jgi:protein subunit release factor B